MRTGIKPLVGNIGQTLIYKRNEEILYYYIKEANEGTNRNIAVLIMKHRGFWSELSHWLYGSPRTSRIRLDAIGSYVWQHLDGSMTAQELIQLLCRHFDQRPEDAYNRLAQFISILKTHGLVVENKL